MSEPNRVAGGHKICNGGNPYFNILVCVQAPPLHRQVTMHICHIPNVSAQVPQRSAPAEIQESGADRAVHYDNTTEPSSRHLPAAKTRILEGYKAILKSSFFIFNGRDSKRARPYGWQFRVNQKKRFRSASTDAQTPSTVCFRVDMKRFSVSPGPPGMMDSRVHADSLQLID